MKFKGWKLWTLVAVVLSAAALTISALPPAAAPGSVLELEAGAQPAWKQMDHEPMWFDMLSTGSGSLSFLRRPIPGSLFGPNAPDFRGELQITGRDIKAGGPFEFGNGDLALMRMGPSAVPEIGESESFALVVAALSWHSVEPVLIDDGSGTSLWHAEVQLSKRGGFPIGRMEMQRETRTGGIASLSVEAPLAIRFYTDDGREVLFDTYEPQTSWGQTMLRASNVAWSLDCGASLLRLPKLSDNICLGFNGSQAAPWQLASGSVRAMVETARSPRVAPGAGEKLANIAPQAVVARSAKIAPSAQVGSAAAIGPRAELAERVTIGAGALVSADTRVGAGAYIGADSYIGPEVRIGAGAVLREGVVVHKDARIGRDVKIGQGALIRSGAVIDDGAVIEAGASIGQGVKVGTLAVVVSGISLVPGTVIGPGVIQPYGNYQCMFPDNTWIAATITKCANLGGAIRGYVPPKRLKASSYNSGFKTSYFIKTQQTPVGNPGGQAGQLGQDIDNSGVAPGNGGQPYTPTTNDCDDFADDLEQYLEGQGWNATFTCLYTANTEHEWYNWLWTGEWEPGHCLTDVHTADGGTVWIEAQWTSGQGAIGSNLDADGDGNVGTSSTPGSALTEGNTRVEVYDSAAAATAAGVVLD